MEINNKNLKKHLKSIFLITIFNIAPFPEKLFADPPVIPKPTTNFGPKEGDVQEAGKYFAETFIPFFTKFFIQISGIIAVVFMIWAGVQFLTPYGNEEKISEAKRAATYSAIGFLVALLSYGIVAILNSIDILPKTK